MTLQLSAFIQNHLNVWEKMEYLICNLFETNSTVCLTHCMLHYHSTKLGFRSLLMQNGKKQQPCSNDQILMTPN